MKIAKLFLSEPIAPPQGNLVGRTPTIIPPHQATIASPFLILETPIRSLSPVAFLFAPDGKGGGYFNSLLIQMPPNLKDAVESTGVIDPNAVEVEHPPLAWQLVLKHATRYWQPFLQRRVPIEELTKTWAESPSVYKMYVDKRKSPVIVTRQNTFIAIRWHVWERHGAISEERAADMEKNECGGLSARSLETRARRLGLRSTI